MNIIFSGEKCSGVTDDRDAARIFCPFFPFGGGGGGSGEISDSLQALPLSACPPGQAGRRRVPYQIEALEKKRARQATPGLVNAPLPPSTQSGKLMGDPRK